MLKGFSSCGSSGRVHAQQVVQKVNGAGIGTGKKMREVFPWVEGKRFKVLQGLGEIVGKGGGGVLYHHGNHLECEAHIFVSNFSHELSIWCATDL